MDIIRLGDTTSHGGTVIEAFGQTDLNGKPMAGVGHQVVCPLCKGTFPITEGPVCRCALQQALAAFSLLVERLHCRQDLLALR